MGTMNKRPGIAGSSLCFPSRVKESGLHFEKLSLECLDLVSLCPDLEAVKSNENQKEGNESQDTISRLFRAQSEQKLIPRS